MRTAYVLRRPVRNAYLVRVRDRRRWRDVLMVLAAVLPVALALLAYTRIHLEVTEIGYRIGVLELRLRETAEHERQLRLEASRLRSPGRIERLARDRLGMIDPAIESTLFVKDSSP